MKSTLSRSKAELRERFFAIRSPECISEILEIEHRLLNFILFDAPHRFRYRTFEIRKKNGGTRTIHAPDKNVAILQRKLVTVLEALKFSKAPAHGFSKGKSIVTNASRHRGKRFVLNVDLLDFFDSIHLGRVRGMFASRPFGLPRNAATVLARLVTNEGRLPQGAPSSPIISNLICRKLDSDLLSLARRHHLHYSRYADDITFSGTSKNFPESVALSTHPAAPGKELLEVINSNGFSVNLAKVRLQSHRQRQVVTGVVVNRKLNTPRRYARQIRSMLHAWEKYGLEKAETEFRSKYDRRNRNPEALSPSFANVVQGKLAFLRMVKGESDDVYRRLSNRLAALAPDLATPVLLEDQAWAHAKKTFADRTFRLIVTTKHGESSGTVFVLRSGILLTAAHNIKSGSQLEIKTPTGERVSVAHDEVLIHPSYEEGSHYGGSIDLAVIVSDQFSGLGSIPVSKADPEIGTELAAMGFPYIPASKNTFTMAVGRVQSVTEGLSRPVSQIQVTMGLAGGMSGGPVFDSNGVLVGVVSEKSFSKGEADVADLFNVVTPASYVDSLLELVDKK